MHTIWIILIGFIVGLVAKMLTPGRDPSGFFRYCQVNGEIAKRPGRMRNVSRLGVMGSFGKMVQRERKAVTQHQSGDMGMHVR
jgi:hypothetical protein